ncbi:putative FAD-linked oxidoreductase YvdP (plasmid) [Streptomyces sp. ADI95-16]|uniref:FAD-binding oxidoreductase n=1 Tax=unclassified Streptomyces TaxID=2593676 RepID=UPI000F3A915F|nr:MULTISPECIES: FAD-binding protein [unclassified Streptomyces]AYV33066.1 putative FAD-linked oxidoreductase YvdP [Streptomyces sp. ADI95-16]RPK24619.1 putative FAD-linked oxidoreductase YvdP [Streptomyces sp. ADI91-18]
MSDDSRGVTITPGDARYPGLVEGYNHRFTGRPDCVRLVRSADEVAAALQEAVDGGLRTAVRSGGHCFEDFTASPDIRVLLDLSPMSAVSYDADMGAFAVEGGATLDRVYQELYDGWGVTIPAGTCFEVGVGGHIAGGGYGHLSRRDGLVVDHLYAVEVVTVDDSGRVRTIVATRERKDPHHDLWWAHTGGGGGNFGVVTRYWLRSPGGVPAAPEQALPRAPRRIRRADVTWSWDSLGEKAFIRILSNYTAWHEENSAPDSPGRHIWSNFIVLHRSAGVFFLNTVIDEDVPGAAELMAAHLAAITSGTDVQPVSVEERVVSWIDTWMPSYSWPSDPRGRYKNKAGYLRRGFTERQLVAVHRHLTDIGYDNPMACLVLTGFGGQVNAVASDATAVPQRDSVLKASYSAGAWTDPAEDDKHTSWVRAFYRDVYAETGGVPKPDDVNDGSYISYPDVDLADPAWNTSDTGWQTLYYKDNYPRLQQVKKAYDPRNTFRHGLSIELPS